MSPGQLISNLNSICHFGSLGGVNAAYSQVVGIRTWALGGAVGSIILSATRVRADQSVNSAGLAVQVENGKSDPSFRVVNTNSGWITKQNCRNFRIRRLGRRKMIERAVPNQ